MKLSPDQIELQTLLRRFFADTVPSEYLRKRMSSQVRRDGDLIERLLQLGLHEGFSSSGEGFGFGDLAVVAEEVGRALFPEPVLERLLGDAVLPRLVSTTAGAALAKLGAQSAFAPTHGSKLSVHKKKGTVSGDISWAFGVDGAERIFAPVCDGTKTQYVAISLGQKGVKVDPTTSLDLTMPLSQVACKDVAALFFDENDSAIIEDAYEILKASEAYGITARVIEMTTEYVKTREQFNVPIGAFQAVQQRLADGYAASESLGALCRFAAWSVECSPHQRRLTARAAVSYASEVGPSVCESAIQCHGGIGFTWEYDLHLLLRRAKVIQSGFGLNGERAESLLTRAKASVG
jgi:alkylation response protein AidB-like acyl-CoA dehydrogenase